MKESLLTERQKQVLRLRRQGLTQQQIADLFSTSKANICAIEKAAMENIRRARETIAFLHTLDAIQLCTITAGTDLLGVPETIYREAEKLSIKVRYDTIELLNRIRSSVPECCHGRYLKDDLTIFINESGDIFVE
ncbi:MAG: Tfx family DNA-binding protein [Methanomicrobiales archaeon]|nr:Tfx family DNA-binding protein [Methanomicrobiales archaeon]